MNTPSNPLRAGCRSTSTLSASQVGAALSAVLLIGASATFGAHFAYSQGVQHGRLMAAAAVAFALGLELSKPLAVAGMIEAGRRWEIGRATLLAVMAAVAILYSLTAELQLMAKSRADVVAARAGQSQAVADARRARDEARRDLDALGQTRPEAELAPVLTAARRTAGDCARIMTAAQRDACKTLPQLESEEARAPRHADALARLQTAETAVGKAGHSRQVDPGAAALASFLGALGVTVPADRLGDWLVLFGVLALEVGSALAGLLVQPAQPAAALPAVSPANPAVPATVQPPVQSAAESARTRVLAIIRDAGGTVQSGQRALAERAGVSPTRLRQVLDGLVAERLLQVRAGSTATTVRLIG